MLNANDILQTIQENAGISYNPVIGNVNPSCGFMVSLPDSEKTLSYLDSQDIEQYIDTLLSKNNPNLYFGAWLDNDTYYLDISENLTDREQALKVGKQREQLAIWDCEKQETIYL